jgi:hypothetical protein
MANTSKDKVMLHMVIKSTLWGKIDPPSLNTKITEVNNIETHRIKDTNRIRITETRESSTDNLIEVVIMGTTSRYTTSLTFTPKGLTTYIESLKTV